MKRDLLSYVVVTGKRNTGKTTSLYILAKLINSQCNVSSASLYSSSLKKLDLNSSITINNYIDNKLLPNNHGLLNTLFVFKLSSGKRIGISTFGDICSNCGNNDNLNNVVSHINKMVEEKCDFIFIAAHNSKRFLDVVSNSFIEQNYNNGLFVLKNIKESKENADNTFLLKAQRDLNNNFAAILFNILRKVRSDIFN